jgi:hypothetical protein
MESRKLLEAMVEVGDKSASLTAAAGGQDTPIDAADLLR